MRLVVLIVTVAFTAALAALTVRDIIMHGITPADVLAVVVLVLLGSAIVGLLVHPPRR